MRILVGHTNRIPEVMIHRPLPGRETKNDHILAFGNGYAHVRHSPGMHWHDLLANCPTGWNPDVYIHWSPEYNAVPRGLENADCLTVGAFGDWNLGGRAIHSVGNMFDALFADRNGGDLLRSKGFENVFYSPLWAYDPQTHRRLPGRRDLDIVMVGSFNHAVQWERSKWLARIARLSRHYNVVVTAGVFGEEYVRLTNRAKIVFNRSIRGELNMRTFEATACGAMLFYERENPEIRDLFTDRVECVLYGDDDLEDLFAYYLAPENAAERERVAQAGWQKVQAHSYAHHFADFLNQVETLVEARRAGDFVSRGFSQLPAEEQILRRANQWFLSCNRETYDLLEEELEHNAEDADMAHFKGVLLAETAYHLPLSHERTDTFERALKDLHIALEIEPDYVMARHNLGWLLVTMGRVTEGETELLQALRQLESPELTPQQLRGPCFPREFDVSNVLTERIWNEFTPESQEWCDALRPVLLGQLYLKLSQDEFQRADFSAAISHAEKAITYWPDQGEAQYHLARALRAMGRAEEAVAAYRQAVSDAPFLLDAWQELTRLTLDLQRFDETLALLDDIIAILHGSPFYTAARSTFEHLRASTQQSAAQFANAPKVTRFIAFPDWNQAGDWQSLVRAFTDTYSSQDRCVLMLRADPKSVPPDTDVLAQLRAFLTQTLGFSTQNLPHVTVLCQELAPEDRWKLYHVADAVLLTPTSQRFQSELAVSARVPLWSPEDLRLRKAA